MKLIDSIRERGGRIFGSSETAHGLAMKARSGEIVTWPYIRQTLSTAPQNTYSVMRPLKAVLDEIEDYAPTAAFWSDIERSLRGVASDLHATSLVGEHGAKAGRVLSGVNESDITASIEALQQAIDRLRLVAGRQTTQHEEIPPQ